MGRDGPDQRLLGRRDQLDHWRGHRASAQYPEEIGRVRVNNSSFPEFLLNVAPFDCRDANRNNGNRCEGYRVAFPSTYCRKASVSRATASGASLVNPAEAGLGKGVGVVLELLGREP